MHLAINTLGRTMRERIVAGTMTDEQVEALFHIEQRGHRARVRAYRRACVMVAIITCVLLAMTAAAAGGFTPAIVFACVAVGVMDIVTLVVVWFIGIEIFRRQFNAALVKGHPAFASRHQL